MTARPERLPGTTAGWLARSNTARLREEERLARWNSPENQERLKASALRMAAQQEHDAKVKAIKEFHDPIVPPAFVVRGGKMHRSRLEIIMKALRDAGVGDSDDCWTIAPGAIDPTKPPPPVPGDPKRKR